MTKKEKDEAFAAHLPGVLQYHQSMLADGVRNRLLYRAIKQAVTRETSFLDVGAGTGVWAILAAKLGAKRVVAIEVEECLIPIIYKHAQENGVADRIEIIHGNSNDVKLNGRFDVIVSELFGGDALGNETVRSFVDLRTRFLAPDGVLIPQKLSMMAAPAHVQNSIHEVPARLPLTTDFLRSIKLNYGLSVPISERHRITFLAEPKTLVEIDFRTVETGPVLENITASWRLKNIGRANAIATFNRSTFTDRIEMNAFQSKSWGTQVYEFVPFEERSGVIQFDLTLDEFRSLWTVSVPSNPNLRSQTFSPAFAAVRIQMSRQMTPHRQVRSKKAKTGRKSDKRMR